MNRISDILNKSLYYCAGKMENSVSSKENEKKETLPIFDKEIEAFSNRKKRDKVLVL